MLSTSTTRQAPSDRPALNQSRPQAASAQPPNRSVSSGPPARNPQTPNQAQSRPGQQAPNNRPQVAPRTTTPNQVSGPRPPPPPAQAGPPPGAVPETVGFFSAKAVSRLPEDAIQGASNGRIAMPQAQQAFNPKAESPSIRKTPGIDHNSSKPVSKSGQHVAPPSSQASAAPSGNTGGFTPVRPSFSSSQSGRGNMVNPSLDHARRLGAPGGPGSPLANRGSYRPPTMKRPPPGDAGAGRPPLVDLPANGSGTATGASGNGLEAKRQKMM